MGLTAEEKRERNARYVREHRERQREREGKIRIEKRVESITFSLAPWSEYLRAGQIAGMLDVCFHHGIQFLQENDARQWINEHPIGGSYVLELLSAAGLSADFLRWRG